MQHSHNGACASTSAKRCTYAPLRRFTQDRRTAALFPTKIQFYYILRTTNDTPNTVAERSHRRRGLWRAHWVCERELSHNGHRGEGVPSRIEFYYRMSVASSPPARPSGCVPLRQVRVCCVSVAGVFHSGYSHDILHILLQNLRLNVAATPRLRMRRAAAAATSGCRANLALALSRGFI